MLSAGPVPIIIIQIVKWPGVHKASDISVPQLSGEKVSQLRAGVRWWVGSRRRGIQRTRQPPGTQCHIVAGKQIIGKNTGVVQAAGPCHLGGIVLTAITVVEPDDRTKWGSTFINQVI